MKKEAGAPNHTISSQWVKTHGSHSSRVVPLYKEHSATSPDDLCMTTDFFPNFFLYEITGCFFQKWEKLFSQFRGETRLLESILGASERAALLLPLVLLFRKFSPFFSSRVAAFPVVVLFVRSKGYYTSFSPGVFRPANWCRPRERSRSPS